MADQYTDDEDDDYDDGLEVDSLAKGYRSKEREFWSLYYDLLTRFSDHRKDLLEKYKEALTGIRDDGTINWTTVDPQRIISQQRGGDGYTKALSHVVPDVKELADAQKIAQSELDELSQLAKAVKKHRKRLATDAGHKYARKEWSKVVQGLEPIRV